MATKFELDCNLDQAAENDKPHEGKAGLGSNQRGCNQFA